MSGSKPQWMRARNSVNCSGVSAPGIRRWGSQRRSSSARRRLCLLIDRVDATRDEQVHARYRGDVAEQFEVEQFEMPP